MNLSSRRWNFYPEASNLHEVIRISKEDKSHFKNITLLFRNYLTMCVLLFHCMCIAWLSAQNLFLSTHKSLQTHIPKPPPQFKCIFAETLSTFVSVSKEWNKLQHVIFCVYVYLYGMMHLIENLFLNSKKQIKYYT